MYIMRFRSPRSFSSPSFSFLCSISRCLCFCPILPFFCPGFLFRSSLMQPNPNIIRMSRGGTDNCRQGSFSTGWWLVVMDRCKRYMYVPASRIVRKEYGLVLYGIVHQPRSITNFIPKSFNQQSIISLREYEWLAGFSSFVKKKTATWTSNNKNNPNGISHEERNNFATPTVMMLMDPAQGVPVQQDPFSMRPRCTVIIPVAMY